MVVQYRDVLLATEGVLQHIVLLMNGRSVFRRYIPTHLVKYKRERGVAQKGVTWLLGGVVRGGGERVCRYIPTHLIKYKRGG